MYKGFRESVRFYDNGKITIVGTVAASGIAMGGTSKTQGFPMVFEGPPRGIRLRSRGPLRAGKALVQDLTFKTFIFTRVYKVFRMKVRF